MNLQMPSTGRQGRRIVDRETKLALLIGFIAILVVGVLVSDHLSDDGRDELADLTAGDSALAPPIIMPPLESGRRAMAEPPPLSRGGSSSSTLDAGPAPLVGVTRSQPSVEEATQRREPERGAARPAPEAEQPRIVQREPDPVRVRPEPSEERRASPPVEDGPPILHIVTAGETLGEIAQRHLGSAARWRDIQRANASQVNADGAIRVGMRLVIPRAAPATETAARTEPETRTQPSQTQTQAQTQRRAEAGQESWGRRYTVVEGDTLWRIAQRELGDGGRWREILNANTDVIPGDGGVTVGLQIRLPGRAAASASGQSTQTQSPPRATSGTRSYTVREGDTLSRIASRELGTVSRMQEILDLNRGVLDDADMIRVGMTIRLPGN
ncbi:MAG: LysM peptidoglycan-binding domain-containing protein [Phycisphaerales bacterium]|nr:MAG: LysM peptidoglycan-binding domain-containing protein [Phycisphaerales bacterium]